MAGEPRNVIAYKNLPGSNPITFSLVVWMMLDYYNASDLVWGVVLTCLVALWVIILYDKCTMHQHVLSFTGKSLTSSAEGTTSNEHRKGLHS